tara:strand:+ start:159 stop:1112 length:954 start_codon:yes stop_codon:yes gene_type:complete
MFKAFSDSFRLSLIERTSSPFIGIFITAWLSFNWRALLILIWGEGSINARLAVIDEKYINTHDNLGWPLLATAIAVAAYPLITYYPFKLWQWSKRKKEIIVEDNDSQKRITAETYQKLKADLKNQRETLSDIIADHDSAKALAFEERDKAQAALEEAGKTHSDEYEQILGIKEKLSSQLETMTGQYQGQSKRSDELEEENNGLINSIKSLEDHTTRLESRCNKFAEERDEAVEKISILSNQHEAKLQELAVVHKDSAGELKTQLKVAQSELDRLKNPLLGQTLGSQLSGLTGSGQKSAGLSDVIRSPKTVLPDAFKK